MDKVRSLHSNSPGSASWRVQNDRVTGAAVMEEQIHVQLIRLRTTVQPRQQPQRQPRSRRRWRWHALIYCKGGVSSCPRSLASVCVSVQNRRSSISSPCSARIQSTYNCINQKLQQQKQIMSHPRKKVANPGSKNPFASLIIIATPLSLLLLKTQHTREHYFYLYFRD